jgi:group I intron endonuclease
MSIGIYKITSPTGKIYVGQSVNIEKRWSKYKRLECTNQKRLYNSLKKYGVSNHSFCILELCEKEELNIKERYYQEIFKVIDHGLNLILTTHENGHRIMSEETRLKQRKSMLGKTHSEESKQKMKRNRALRKINFEKNQKDYNTKKVINIITNEIYYSITDCALKNNIPRWKLGRQLKKNTNPIYKYYEIV